MTRDAPAAAESGYRRVWRAGLVVAVTLVLVGCGRVGGQPGGGEGDTVDADLAGSLSAERAAAAADDVNAFGFDLHAAIAEDGDNIVTSPVSSSVMLAMVAAGAGGDNAEEMVEVLGLDGPRDTRYAALLAGLVGTDDVTLAVASSLWSAEGYPFEDDYVSFVQETYGATLDEVDLGSQGAADAIDDWVDERTEGLIDEVAADLGLPDPQAVLVLLNTVYYRGTWTTAFDEADTREAPFALAGGDEVVVRTMHRSAAEVEASFGDGFQMLRLPYGDDERFGMEVLLPVEDVALDELLDDLDAEVWADAVDGLQTVTFSEIALPCFELEWDANLNEVLRSLGMVSAFEGGDFSPMSPADPFLDTVVQKTYIRVDEAGTEAAAVTGGVMAESAGPPPFRVDRPFAFTISDRETGAVLFLGSVHDPRG
ncbi:serpin family protein [Agromyces sp. H3Y2-19a]|uniref:serpin family protein n=1 Tax=Agromyces chromiiresistens TaxID=3030835 RepID=UPI0023B96FBE|nr:serpin family protein [Agromyces chromiiresistens]MDF0512489.1 serpin family protein [Agromyces chromiiresistens]